MSVSVSTPQNYFNDTPFDPIDFFNAWRTQTQIPSLVIQKIDEILDQYYQIKPEKAKRQNQMKILFKYNQKLVETVEQFIAHEKKIVDRYNALCQLYVTSFQKYCSSKSWDVNFNVKPIKSHFEKFSLKDWKFQISQPKQLEVENSYSSMLLNTIKQYFLNSDKHLQKVLEKMIDKHSLTNNQQGALHIQQIKLAISEVNTTTITKDNMFDLLQKRKSIQYQIREFQQEFDFGFFKNDMNFIDEIKHIHSLIFQIQPEKIKEYLKNENHIRRRMKKKSKACRKELEERIQRIQQDNCDLKIQIEHERKKREDIQKEKEKIKSLYDYHQLRSAGKRDKNQFNTSIIMEDSTKNNEYGKSTENVSIVVKKPLQEKQQVKISQLEAEINRLKAELSERQLALKKSPNKSDIRKDEILEEMKKTILSKWEEYGMKQEREGLSINILLQKLLQKVNLQTSISVKSEHKSENIHIMVESHPDEVYPIKRISIKKPSQRQKDFMQLPLWDKRETMSAEFSSEKLPPSPSLRNSRQLKSSGEIPISNQLKSSWEKDSRDLRSSKQLAMDNIIQIHEVERVGKFQQRASMMKKYNTLGNSPSIDLHSISEKKSMDQESKNNYQPSKAPSDQRVSDKNSVLNKPEQETREMIKLITKLQQENTKLHQQIVKLKGDLIALEVKLSEKQRAPLNSFINNLDLGPKILETNRMQQIEGVCCNLVKEMAKLQATEFQKMLNNIQTVIQTFSNSLRKSDTNINEIPILSKTIQDQNLFKSENIAVAQPKSNNKSGKQRQRPVKLALHSGEVKYLINMDRSIYFGHKEQAFTDTNRPGKYTHPKNTIIPQVESKFMDQDLNKEDDFIDGVANFEGMSRKREKNPRDNISDNSLRYSIDQRDEQLRSSLKLNPRLLQDTELLLKIERKIDQIKNNGENAQELYWFYKKYKQAMDALEKTEATLRQHQNRKESCLKKLSTDQVLSKHKLEESIYFLQQRVKDLQAQLQSCKDQYETNMTKDMTEIQKLKETVLRVTVKNLYPNCK